MVEFANACRNHANLQFKNILYIANKRTHKHTHKRTLNESGSSEIHASDLYVPGTLAAHLNAGVNVMYAVAYTLHTKCVSACAKCSRTRAECCVAPKVHRPIRAHTLPSTGGTHSHFVVHIHTHTHTTLWDCNPVTYIPSHILEACFLEFQDSSYSLFTYCHQTYRTV